MIAFNELEQSYIEHALDVISIALTDNMSKESEILTELQAYLRNEKNNLEELLDEIAEEERGF